MVFCSGVEAVGGVATSRLWVFGPRGGGMS